MGHSRLATGLLLLAAVALASGRGVCDENSSACISVTPRTVRATDTSIDIAFDRFGIYCDAEGTEGDSVVGCKSDQPLNMNDRYVDTISLVHERDLESGLRHQMERQRRMSVQPTFIADVQLPSHYSIKHLDDQLYAHDHPSNDDSEPATSVYISPCDEFDMSSSLKGSFKCIQRCADNKEKACGMTYSTGNSNVATPGRYYALLCSKRTVYSGFLNMFGESSFYCAAMEDFEVLQEGSTSRSDITELAKKLNDVAGNDENDVGYLRYVLGLGFVSELKIPLVMGQNKIVEEECTLPPADTCMNIFSSLKSKWTNEMERVETIHNKCTSLVNTMADDMYESRTANPLFEMFRRNRVVINRAKCISECMTRMERIANALNSPCQYKRGEFKEPDDWEAELYCVSETFGEIMGKESVEKLAPGVWSQKVYAGWDTEKKNSLTFAFEKESSSPTIANVYRPPWISEEDWGKFCPDSTSLCHDPFCGKGAKMCVQNERSPHWLLHQCIHHKEKGEWVDAFGCARAVVQERFGSYPWAFVANFIERLKKNLYAFWFQKGVRSCVMKQPKEVFCTRKVPSEQNDVFYGQRHNAFYKAIEDDWPVELPVHNGHCRGGTPYMTEDVANCLGEVRNSLDSFISPLDEDRSKTLVDWMATTALPHLKAAYRLLASPKADAEEYPDSSIYSDWERLSWTPKFLSEKLVQEVDKNTWEVNSDTCESTLESIYLKIGALQMMFANYNSLHLHVVFPRPKSNCCHCVSDLSDIGKCKKQVVALQEGTFECEDECLDSEKDEASVKEQAEGFAAYRLNNYLASLASHMNDYAALGVYRANAYHKYLAVFKSSTIKELRKAVAWGGKTLTSIESKTEGHSWGDFKKAFIAIRAGIYGNENLMGYEFRAGPSAAISKSARSLSSVWDASRVVSASSGTDFEHSLFVANIISILRQLTYADTNEVSDDDAESLSSDSESLGSSHSSIDSPPAPPTSPRGDRGDETVGLRSHFIRDSHLDGPSSHPLSDDPLTAHRHMGQGPRWLRNGDLLTRSYGVSPQVMGWDHKLAAMRAIGGYGLDDPLPRFTGHGTNFLEMQERIDSDDDDDDASDAGSDVGSDDGAMDGEGNKSEDGDDESESGSPKDDTDVEEETGGYSIAKSIMKQIDQTRVQLSVYHLLKGDNGLFSRSSVQSAKQAQQRRNNITIRDVDEFQLKKRLVDYNFFMIEKDRDNDLYRKWCQIPDMSREGPLVSIEYEAGGASKGQIGALNGVVRKIVDKFEAKVAKWTSRYDSGDATKLIILLQPEELYTRSQDEYMRERSALANEIVAEVSKNVAQGMMMLEVQEVVEKKKNKNKNKNKNRGGGKKNRDPLEVVKSASTFEEKAVEWPSHPRGCHHFRGTSYIPYAVVDFTVHMISQAHFGRGLNLPHACLDDYEGPEDSRVYFRRVAEYVVEKGMPSTEMFVYSKARGDDYNGYHSRMETLAIDACKYEAMKKHTAEALAKGKELTEGERGKLEKEANSKCRKTPTPNMRACIESLYYRWSFILLNIPNWESFLVKKDKTDGAARAGSKIEILGKEYPLSSYNKDMLYENFFNNPTVLQNCIERNKRSNIDRTRANQCGQYINQLTAALEDADNLKELVME